MSNNQFWVNALGDKLLFEGGIVKYMLFFEADQRFSVFPAEFHSHFELFRTRNGFHAIGRILSDADGKRFWFSEWKRLYPATDYMLNNWNFLMPHTEDELDFIINIARPVFPQMVKYYRDKRVFETFAESK